MFMLVCVTQFDSVLLQNETSCAVINRVWYRKGGHLFLEITGGLGW